ncbi:MAG: hypothetical protein AB7E42_01940 [Anaerotignaceae bacterium]
MKSKVMYSLKVLTESECFQLWVEVAMAKKCHLSAGQLCKAKC